MLLRKRAIIAASLSLIIFTSTISVLMGIGAAPQAVMGNPDAYVIMSKGTNSVLNSRLDESLAQQLIDNGIVENASSELFAFATIHGSAVIVRGVQFDQFMKVEDATLLSGTLPTGYDGALVGKMLADRTGIRIGERIPLVGSYDPSVCEAVVTGIIDCESGVADELMVTLPLARCISGAAQSQVSIVRVTGNVSHLDDIFGPGNPRFSIFDLSLPVKEVGVGVEIEISLKIKNWGDVNGTANITISDTTLNSTIAIIGTDVAYGQQIELKVNHSFNQTGIHQLKASLGGAIPQNITENMTVRSPFLAVVAPARVAEHNNFTVMVTDHAFAPVGNAEVTVSSFSFETNSSGICIINATLAPGMHSITAAKPGYDGAVFPFEVVNSSSLPPAASIQAYDLRLSPQNVKVRENCTMTMYIQNFGNSSGTSLLRLHLNGNAYASRSVTLAPLAIKVLFLNVSFTTAGDREFTIGNISETLHVEAQYALNPQLIQLLLRYGGTGTLDPSSGQLIYNTARISEGNILIVLISLAVLSATLVTIGISISFMKEIHDQQRVIGILRSLGASSRQLLSIIFKEAFILSLPSAAIGLAGGFAISMLIASSGDLVAFGHTIEPVLDPSYLIAAVGGSMMICIGSSLLSGLVSSRRRAIRMIRGLAEEGRPEIELKDLIGED